MPSTVLIVEDDPNTAELVRLYLGRDGHADGLHRGSPVRMTPALEQAMVGQNTED